MQKIDGNNGEVLPAPLDLFSSKPVNIAITDTNYVEYNPVNPQGTLPIRFTINSGDTYLDLSSCYLQTTFNLKKKEVTKVDGKDVTKFVTVDENDKVSLINGFGATAIKNLKVSFNGRQVYNSNDLYAYNAYIRRRLGIETSQKKDDLELAGFVEDNEMSQITGEGFDQRREYFYGGQFQSVAHLDADIFKQKKLLLNSITVDIEITPHDPNFMLISQDKNSYSLTTTDFKLYVKQHHILPQLDMDIQQKLKEGNLVRYPYTRNFVTTHYITPGRFDYKATLSTDFIPKRVFVALVDGKAFNGSISSSPFDFGTYNISHIHLSANSKLLPTYPYDFSKKDFSRCFKDLVDTCGGTGMNIEKYTTHSCIFAFDLRALSNNTKSTELQKMGTTGISIKFSKAVPVNGLQAIFFIEYDNLMAFDFARNYTTPLPV